MSRGSVFYSCSTRVHWTRSSRLRCTGNVPSYCSQSSRNCGARLRSRIHGVVADRREHSGVEIEERRRRGGCAELGRAVAGLRFCGIFLSFCGGIGEMRVEGAEG